MHTEDLESHEKKLKEYYEEIKDIPKEKIAYVTDISHAYKKIKKNSSEKIKNSGTVLY